jgi:hypothetical protein
MFVKQWVADLTQAPKMRSFLWTQQKSHPFATQSPSGSNRPESATNWNGYAGFGNCSPIQDSSPATTQRRIDLLSLCRDHGDLKDRGAFNASRTCHHIHMSAMTRLRSESNSTDPVLCFGLAETFEQQLVDETATRKRH